jgi:hypothetical protein
LVAFFTEKKLFSTENLYLCKTEKTAF